MSNLIATDPDGDGGNFVLYGGREIALQNSQT